MDRKKDACGQIAPNAVASRTPVQGFDLHRLPPAKRLRIGNALKDGAAFVQRRAFDLSACYFDDRVRIRPSMTSNKQYENCCRKSPQRFVSFWCVSCGCCAAGCGRTRSFVCVVERGMRIMTVSSNEDRNGCEPNDIQFTRPTQTLQRNYILFSRKRRYRLRQASFSD